MASVSALRPVQNGCKLADGVFGVLLVWTLLYCCSIVLIGLFLGPNKQNAGIGSDDGLVPFRQNAIVGTNDGLLLMHMCATRPKWVNVIFTPGFTVISTPLKGIWYVECLFCYAWMIIIKSLFSRKAGNRQLGGLSSLVATWVVITTTCGANSDEISGCRLNDLLFAVLLLTEYLHPFYCDIYITEMCMKILFIVLLCLETSLSLHLFLFSPKEASRISQFYRRRWHRVLAFDSVRCHRWRWGSVGVVGLTVFGLRCPINIIFTPVLLWYPHYWNV